MPRMTIPSRLARWTTLIAIAALALITRAPSAESTVPARPSLSTDPPPVGKAQRTELALPAVPLSARQQAQAAEKQMRIPPRPTPVVKAPAVSKMVPKPNAAARPAKPARREAEEKRP